MVSRGGLALAKHVRAIYPCPVSAMPVKQSSRIGYRNKPDSSDLEAHQGGAARNRGGAAALAVRIVVPQGQLDLLSLLHCGNSSVPAFDYLTGTQCEAKRVPSVHRGIELGAIGERSRIVHCTSKQRVSVRIPLASCQSICHSLLFGGMRYGVGSP